MIDKKRLFLTAWNIFWFREEMTEEPPELVGEEGEFYFCPTRRFRADYAILDYMILIEVNGNIGAKKGGHHSWSGYHQDVERLRIASSLGYRCFWYTTHELAGKRIKKGKPPYTAIELIQPIYDCIEMIDRQRG